MERFPAVQGGRLGIRIYKFPPNSLRTLHIRSLRILEVNGGTNVLSIFSSAEAEMILLEIIRITKERPLLLDIKENQDPTNESGVLISEIIRA